MQNWSVLNNFKFNPRERDALNNLIVNLLSNRGVKTQNEINSFLNPDLKSTTYKSVGIKKDCMDKAILKIKNAIKNKEKIVIYTDYDADGILSGAILWETLYALKADVMPFVPNRLTEGYGLSKTGIDKVKRKLNPKLLITVDHGITKVKEVEYAKKLGMEVIIIDHHLPPEKLPEAVSIIHTTGLCATGLVWIFVNYLMGKMLTGLLDLVAIGTVADLVPLIGPNRTLVKFGLKQVNKTRRIGLNALINFSGLKKGEIDAFALSHILAPRLNASGRLTDALDSLRLICTKDRLRAHDLAEELNSVNRNRQNLTKESTDIAFSQVQSTAKIIFTGHESFHQGIIGLIAGKLVETYKRPAVVVSIGEEICKASVRSVKGVNIVDLLMQVSEFLIDVGGHPMAAGFTVHKSNLEILKNKLNLIADKANLTDHQTSEIFVDMEFDPGFMENKIFSNIQSLAPFGQANPKPLFAAFNLAVLNARLVGREKNHLKLKLASSNNPEKEISAIAFNFGKLFTSLSNDSRIDIVYEIDKDDWNGENCLILKLKDARLAA